MILKPKNWGEFQHYKDRDPLWIKLHKRLLDDFEFQALPVIARAVAPMLWLLASENKDGAFDADERKLAFRLRLSVEEIRAAMTALLDAGFFVEADEDEQPQRSRAQERREANGFGNRHISDEVKRAVWARDGGKCQSCASTENIEYDHIMPVSKGGNSEQENVQLLCRPCNRSKRTKTAEQFGTERLSSRSPEKENKGQVKKQEKTEKKRASAPISFPDWLPKEPWEAYVEMRKRIRAPLTDKAIELELRELSKFREAGDDPAEVLNQAVRKAWRGLWPLSKSTGPPAPQTVFSQPLVDLSKVTLS